MKLEHYSQPMASHQIMRCRMIKFFGFAWIILFAALLIGVLGYHFLGELSWVDAILEASMILGGMGPVATMKSNIVKLFASFYALFSGFVLLSSFGIFTIPLVHRMLHYFHLKEPK